MKVNNTENNEPSLGRTVIDDFRQGDFRNTLYHDFEELKEYYLSEERKERLKYMGTFKSWFFMAWWLIKSMFFKLTHTRRILLVVSIVLMLFSRNIVILDEKVQINTNFTIISGLILLFVLMLELKDKLLARSELEIGRSVQTAMMPEQNPDIPGWNVWIYSRPAKEVGGDLVDYQKLGEKRYGIALGDVAGKGLGAALFMVKLLSTLRALAPDFHSISEFIDKINNIFHRDSSSKSFASLAYVELKSDSDMVKIVNAGHMPPVIVKGINTKEITKSGPAIGLMPNIEYHEKIVEMHKNDTLFIYSDGLNEARSSDGNFFGQKKMMNLLRNINRHSPKEFGEILLSELDNFTNDAVAHDDLSLVIIRREVD